METVLPAGWGNHRDSLEVEDPDWLKEGWDLSRR